MSDAVSGAALRSIDDLPDLIEMAASSGTEGFSEDFAELFALDERLLRAGSRRIVVFRNEDLRKVAAHPSAGNMPVSVLSKRAYLDNAATSPITDDDRKFIARLLFNQVFTVNPPLHAPTRQVFARPLMPKFMSQFVPVAQRIVGQLIDEVSGTGEIDFSFQFTEKLTARFWGELFGMTADEQEQVVEFVRTMTPFFFIERTPEETIAVNAATGEYLDVVAGAVHRTLARGGNALLTGMAAEFDAIDLGGKPESLGMSIAANVIDGFHTAALAAANAVYHLLRNPDALAAVKAEPKLATNALAEGLRMSPPVIVTHRYALADFEYAGTQIPEGTAIAMLWSAGNRDPDVFEEPSRYDLMRVQRGDATFGGGIHICPGRHIARVLADAVLEGVAATDVRISLGEPFEWIARSTMRQPYRMPVTIDRIL